jgi:hypothetical protein
MKQVIATETFQIVNVDRLPDAEFDFATDNLDLARGKYVPFEVTEDDILGLYLNDMGIAFGTDVLLKW